jgi:PAS domain S-box-containing protein
MTDRAQIPGADLFALAVDLCPAGMLATDAQGTILLVNREIERLFGYRREELLGQSIDILVPPRFRGVHPGFRARYMSDSKTRPMGAGRDLYGVRKDGSEAPVEIGLNPVDTEHGRVILASVVDISARRLVEDQLRQSQKMEAIGTLAGGIAHDFNNILLAINGHAELAKTAAELDEQHEADLDQVLNYAERGRQLVQRILTFSRARKITRTRVLTQRIVRETLQLLRASLPTTIEISETIAPETPELLADETQVQQVLMNLVTNAAYAMPEGGVLDVIVGPFTVDAKFAQNHGDLPLGPYVQLSVIDAGVGMSSEVLARVFEPFFTTKPSGSGTGLGLSVTLGIVQSHGGAIDIRSRLGLGTRADVYLPSVGLQIAAAVSEPADERKHVLLVDDDPGLVKMMQRQLERAGYRVTIYTSSVAALDAFQRQPSAFDLLTTDNTMPRMTGLALTREVKAIRPDIPVLFVSGLIDTVDPEALYSHGVTKFLAKPHTAADLMAAVESLIGKPTAARQAGVPRGPMR